MDNGGYIGMEKIHMQLIGFMECKEFQKHILPRINMSINLSIVCLEKDFHLTNRK
jgi:hypothetical protein